VAGDGLSCTEHRRNAPATALGITAVRGEAGLAWSQNRCWRLAVESGNRAWDIAPRFVEDVTQPYARLPGLPRNFG
jgi:hypothetical protein